MQRPFIWTAICWFRRTFTNCGIKIWTIAPCMAVSDEIITSVSHPEGLPNYVDLDLPPDVPYFNSGLLVMNLSRWREEALSTRIL